MWKTAYKIVDICRRTQAYSVYEELVKTQWLSKRELDNLQFQRLKRLLIHCQKNVPYYSELFRNIGFQAFDIKTFDDILCIPILTKDEIRMNFEKLKSKNFQKFQPRVTQTGGSTGKPLVTYKDRISHSYLVANNLRLWHQCGYDIGDKYIMIANGSLLPNKNSIKNKVYFILQNSKLITSYHLDAKALEHAVEIIKHTKAKFIYGYSSSFHLLAQYIHKKNIKINNSTLKALFTTSDMLYPKQRTLIEQTFNVKVFDSYGCPEGGIISFECEYHNGYHINQESAYVEIVNKNETGFGKIISTPLFNYAFPMIRYDTGDVGSITEEKCSCGRGLSRIKQLGGRIRDFIVLEDGRYIHGAFFNHLDVFYNSHWIKEYQIIQEDVNHLIIKFSCIRKPTNQELKIIDKEIKRGLLQSIKIDFDLNGVEYTQGGKFRLIISKVKTKWE